MYAEILVEIKNKHVDKTFTYHVLDDLCSKIAVGKRVLVPFGKQQLEGYCLNLKSTCDFETKDILEVLDEEPVLNQEMILLGERLQQETLCSLSSCYATMLPKALKASKKSQVNKKIVTFLKLGKNKEEILDEITSKPQQDIINLFCDNLSVLKSKANQVSSSAVKTLLKKGYLIETLEEVYRYQLNKEEKDESKVLNMDQQKCVQEIISSQDSDVFLLHGVTGSGKTEVYLQVISQKLSEGKTALVLVPEISLTPQFVERFNKRFPDLIAVLHSGLSDGERYDEWRKIMKRESQIVIGARSAIFAPLENIGIIIIDEEHSESYKQGNNPKYNTISIAKRRCQTHHCPLVLGSATPTLDSMARAMKKVYHYLSLPKRANGAILPHIEIIDMQEEVKNRHMILSRELECKIIEKINKHEQVMLLLNRRGHSTVITCSNCGYTYRCPHCEISLTYHKSSGSLRCHYCGYTKYLDDRCPNCHEESLNYYGLGTEKLEDYLRDVFPTARIVRMDADSTANKGMHEKITTAFYNHEYDILLGTQMISKGLDFPNVSLVGILGCDAVLNIPDYRSNERTFSLLSQASGRAGRGRIQGEVILQTFYPDHYIFKCVKNNDYFAFFKYEMNIRKTLRYPPFYYLAQITIKSKSYEKASAESRKVKEYLEKNLSKESLILGPATANMFLVNRVYHFEILIKYRHDSNLFSTLKELDQIYLIHKDVQLDFDL